MTWELVPEKPNELTPASGPRPDAAGQSVSAAVTRTGKLSQSICGFGVRKLRCFGIVPRRIESRTLMRPAAPAAAAKWPILVFTEPTSSGLSAVRPRP